MTYQPSSASWPRHEKSPHTTFTSGRRVLLALTAITMLTVSGCSDHPAPSGTKDSTTTSASTSPGIGEDVKGNGVTLRVNDAYTTREVQLHPDSTAAHNDGATEATTAREGGVYVVVETTLTNDGTDDMDLTCGFGVQAKLTTTPEASYNPIDSLYLIPGNPRCNDNLGPGFDDDMTWIFLVPEDTSVDAFGFSNPDVAYDDLTYVSLGDLEFREPEQNQAPSPTPPNAPAPEAEGAADSDGVAETVTPDETDSVPAAAAPAYGVPCSASQALQPATAADGTSLVCVGMGGDAGYTWVYGPAGQGAGTASDGAVCTDGDEGGQDAQGRLMMCMGGEWIYGP